MNDTANFSHNCFLPISTGGLEVTEFGKVAPTLLYQIQSHSPVLLVVYCVVNAVLFLSSSGGNLAVLLTILHFAELRITSNLGLASLSAAYLLHGSTLHIAFFAAGVNVLKNGCHRLFKYNLSVVRYIAYVFAYNSVFNTCLVTFERYTSVVHSLRCHVILPRERMIKLAVGVWVTSLLFGLSHAIDSSHFNTISRALVLSSLLILFAVLFYGNIRMYLISRGHRRRVITQLGAVQQVAFENQRRFRGAGTVFLTLITLVICYLPATVIRLLAIGSDVKTRVALSNASPWAAVIFVMYSSVTPFVYFFRSRELRSYAKKLLRKALRCMGRNAVH